MQVFDQFGNPENDLAMIEPWLHYVMNDDGEKAPILRITYSRDEISIQWGKFGWTP